MAISKEQALINISKARLQKMVAFQLYIDNTLNAGLHAEYVRSESKYFTLSDAYIDCGIITYAERDTLPEYKISS